MILFPWLVLIAVLLVLTIAVLDPAEAWRLLRRRRRLRERPAARLVATLLVIEVALILVWGLIVLGGDR